MTFVTNPAIGEHHLKEEKKLQKETTKRKYEEERRELEKELHENKIEIEKLFNEKFEYCDEKIEYDCYFVRFKKSGEDSYKELKFEFEENYMHLKHMWKTEEE
ncbi:MAG: hypothetical protein GT589_07480 [Peptoclostridium sp.]|uniref:hypothetical protein n=1 Tax=Peptoclostridium sp. TaxID=1904860 RepID=UPI00139F0EF0|nr:hypothetical protein [Peptoclostridium sp.]MZQ75972.1 hypothetical protein [Peptoclostridium sp.]